jgi:septum site-determining protein MinC
VAGKSHITIKGIKEGLVFLLDDECSFDELLEELKAKLDKHEQQFTGPIVHVFLKLGRRKVGKQEETRLREAFRKQGNLLVQSVESDVPDDEDASGGQELRRMSGIVRSGQTVECRGSLLFLGDVNPGGTVSATGDIYVLGALRGIAHAGCDGDEKAIIAASLMKPMQLRIAGVVSRPPEEWTSEEPWMEYAYLDDGKMRIDKLSSLSRIRKEVMLYKGV